MILFLFVYVFSSFFTIVWHTVTFNSPLLSKDLLHWRLSTDYFFTTNKLLPAEIDFLKCLLIHFFCAILLIQFNVSLYFRNFSAKFRWCFVHHFVIILTKQWYELYASIDAQFCIWAFFCLWIRIWKQSSFDMDWRIVKASVIAQHFIWFANRIPFIYM